MRGGRFCWIADGACIRVFEGLIAVPVAIWVGRWLARWFRHSWMRRGDESARPRGTWVLVRWVVVGAWLGFVATWLAGLVILLTINALGIALSEEDLPSLFPVAGFTAGALAGAILMPRLMAAGSPLR